MAVDGPPIGLDPGSPRPPGRTAGARMIRARRQVLNSGRATALAVALGFGAAVPTAIGAVAAPPPEEPVLLPVSILRPDGPPRAMAVFVSGDGGWGDLEASVGRRLADDGVAVVGLDARRYFERVRRPDETAADIAGLFEHYERLFETTRFALVGFSFGADIMPDVWPLLPEAIRDRTEAVSLLGLGRYADFEVTVATTLGLKSADSRPLAPLIAHLPLERTLCIAAFEEVQSGRSSCTEPAFQPAEVITLPGDHVFNRDYNRVADAIARRLKR